MRAGVRFALTASVVLSACCLAPTSSEPPVPSTAVTDPASAALLAPPPDRGAMQVAVYWVADAPADPVARFRETCRDIAVLEALGSPGAASAVVALRTDYAAPDVEGLGYFGRGLDEADARALQAPAVVLVATMEVAPAGASAAARALTTCIATLAAPGGFVWDEETRLMYSLEAYRAGPVADWDDGVPSFTDQVTVHAMPDNPDGTLRAVSLGMRRFARSDLVIPSFGEQHFDNVGRLLTWIGQTMIEGGEPADHVHLDPASVHEAAIRADLEGASAGDLALRPAPAEEGDPPRLLEVVFPGEPSVSVIEREAAFLESVFGADRLIGTLDPDAQLEALSAAARTELAARRGWFLAGVPAGQHLRIATLLDAASTEIVWVEVTSWPDPQHLAGRLASEPRHAPGVHSGDTVSVSLADVQDYTIEDPEHRLAGGQAYDYALRIEH